jgi:hypothetical protein
MTLLDFNSMKIFLRQVDCFVNKRAFKEPKLH